MKSWRTTALGIGAILTALGNALTGQFDADVTTNPEWGVVIAAVIAGVGLIMARDNNKSSEDVGAK